MEKLELGNKSKYTRDIIAAMHQFNNLVELPQLSSQALAI
jgi:hypothetical protein